MTQEQFEQSSLSDWCKPDFWRGICPRMGVCGGDGEALELPPSTTSCSVDRDNVSKKRREQLRNKGFVSVDEQVAEATLIGALREGTRRLHELGFPASFILLFDLTWQLAAVSRIILKKSTLETNSFNFDLLAWCIESGGFSPHRDRQPEDVASSFCNGEAKFVTHWISLTEATPENSCLYMIPKDCDPGYEAGDTDDQDPLQCALPNKEAFQHIRACPRMPGQSILFTHRIVHWGSARDPDTLLPPRIAISFVCSDPSYEKPYINPSYFTVSEDSSKFEAPPFHIRLLLVCAQLLIYHQRFNLPRHCIKACYEYCKQHENELEESYRQKVFLEFVSAMKETIQSSSSSQVKQEQGGTKDANNDSEEDEEEAMMEEMLNAEEKGYGEFEDDYDLNEDEPEQGARNGDNRLSEEEDEEDVDEKGSEGASFLQKRKTCETATSTGRKEVKIG